MRREKKVDVLVVGGGPAGIGAAISAARNGAHVLLAERYFFLGGMGTLSLVAGLYTQWSGERRILGGIVRELMDSLIQRGEAREICVPMSASPGVSSSRTEINPEAYKYLVEQKAVEAGVELLYGALFSDVRMEGDRVVGAVLETKSETWEVDARVVVDCTGDGDVAAFAGARFDKGERESGTLQPISMLFLAGNVDVERVFAFWASEEAPRCLRAACARGEIPMPSMALHNPGWERDIIVSMSRTACDATDSLDLTRGQIAAREQIHRVFEFLKVNFPGFEHAYMVASSTQVGVRETRRIVGRYTLTREDVIETRPFPDAIALGAYPIDIHRAEQNDVFFEQVARGDAYGVPYRCLVPADVEGLLVAGRCVSATREALGAIRVQLMCMAMGEAAGAAAALCIREAVQPGSLDPALLRRALRAQGVILD
ncbi:MAG: FAD-dependent oxidoreductase [Rhodospirillales bacterium]|nr:FAD-dependent oxidoreductase [Rhodospirillales bacterium]